MFSQLDMQLETKRWTNSGWTRGLVAPPFPALVSGTRLMARRLTTSMLCRLMSMPTRAERYSLRRRDSLSSAPPPLLPLPLPPFLPPPEAPLPLPPSEDDGVRTRSRHSLATTGLFSTSWGKFCGVSPHSLMMRRARISSWVVSCLDGAWDCCCCCCCCLPAIDPLRFRPFCLRLLAGADGGGAPTPPALLVLLLAAPRACRTLRSASGERAERKARSRRRAMTSSSAAAPPGPPPYPGPPPAAPARSDGCRMSLRRRAGYSGRSQTSSDRRVAASSPPMVRIWASCSCWRRWAAP
mmetsp:Transcript_30891/g.90282  ORF Transcript_30891/g.90282 Transcript_30891/m.90282 type:complete len:296 (-) Transcript_30891:924-1811(-)